MLSRALVAEELGDSATVAWFLLDDYAEWLGQREEGIADILALSVTSGPNGDAKLRAIVTEAKYIDASGLSEASRKSRQQLRHTVARMDDALFGDPGRLDRDLWLSRIADLLLDGTAALGNAALLERVRDGIRRGSVPIDMRGYSHIFVSGPADDGSSHGEQEQVADIANGFQETFSREGLRQLIKAYEARAPLASLRSALGEARPWDQAAYREPAARVDWTNTISIDPKGALPTPLISDFDDDEDGFDEGILRPSAAVEDSVISSGITKAPSADRDLLSLELAAVTKEEKGSDDHVPTSAGVSEPLCI